MFEKMARIHRTIQKNFNDPDHEGVITHLEPDILECEVKWALESITTNNASGGDGIPCCMALAKSLDFSVSVSGVTFEGFLETGSRGNKV